VLLDTILNKVNIKPDEKLSVLLFFTLSLLYGFTILIFTTTANTLFLMNYSANVLIRVFIFTSLITIFSGMVISKAKEIYSDKVVYTTIAAFVFLCLSGFYISTVTYNSRLATFFMMGSVAFLESLLDIVFWSLSYNKFNLRQGKRLFSVIDSGFSIAFILGGCLIPTFIHYLSIQHLLVLCVISSFFFFLLAKINMKVLDIKFNESTIENQEKKPSFFSVLKSPYISLLYFIIFIFGSCMVLTNFIFLQQTQAKFTDSAALAKFFGLFYSYLAGAILLTNLFFSGKLLARFGIGIGISTLPSIWSLSFFSIFAYYMYANEFSYYMIAASFFIIYTTSITINSISQRLLMQPFRQEIKNILPVYITSYITPLAKLGSSALLFIAIDIFKVSTIYLIVGILLSAITWFIAALSLKKKYVKQLQSRLRKRRGNFLSSENFISKNYKDLFINGMASNNAGEVLYSYKQLVRIDPDSIENYLQNLMEYRNEEDAIIYGLHEIRTRGLSSYGKKTLSIADDQENSSRLRGKAIQAYCNLKEKDISKATVFLEHKNSLIRKETLLGLLNSEDPYGILEAENLIKQYIQSGNKEDRLIAAQVIGKAKLESHAKVLETLIHDDDFAVRQEVMLAGANMKILSLVPDIIKSFDEVKVRKKALKSLTMYGDELLPVLDKYLDDYNTKYPIFKNLVIAISRDASDKAKTFLFEKLKNLSLRRRDFILKNLVQSKFKLPDTYRPQINDFISSEFKRLLFTSEALIAFENDEKYKNVNKGLERGISNSMNRITCYLTLKHPMIDYDFIHKNLNSSSCNNRALALEFLDNKLEDRNRKILLPLFDAQDYKAIKTVVQKHFQESHLSSDEFLHEIIKREKEINLWTRASILFLVGNEKDQKYQQDCIEMTGSKEWIIRQTAAWALYAIDPTKFSEYKEGLT
jgi:AAA family ATP:ADP antiporter